MDELLSQFIVEAVELTQQASDDLLALAKNPGNRPHLESVFRAIHTLKGSVGLFDLRPMQRVLHAAEDVLSLSRRDGGELDPDRIDPLLTVVEWVDRCVSELDRAAQLSDKTAGEAAALIKAMRVGEQDPAAATPAEQFPTWATALLDAHQSLLQRDLVLIRYAPASDCFFNGDDPLALMNAVPDVVVCEIAPARPWPVAEELDLYRCNLVLTGISTASSVDVEKTFRLIPDQVSLFHHRAQGVQPAQVDNERAARSMRVDVARVDRLVDAIGELMTAKNAISTLVAEAKEVPGARELARKLGGMQQEIERLVAQTQRDAMRVRMVPLSETLRRMPRLVRELSGQTGKPTDVSIEGDHIEADKAIVDGLYDPLLHIVRNAVDHGNEGAEARIKLGKSPRGTVRISARQVGYQIQLDVADDGAGIDAQRIRNSAIAKGLIPSERVEALSDEEALELVFMPGFSTAAAVNDISGRGVGMDAVRAAVRRLGGRAGIASVPGQGTVVTLSFPTAFTVSQIMIVDVAGERFALPMASVIETTRVPGHQIHTVRVGEAFVLRNRTIPVVRLAAAVGLTAARKSDELVVVVELFGGPVGIVVDGIGERLESMLKPPAGVLKALPGISGTTVLGDGRVVLALDLEELIG